MNVRNTCFLGLLSLLAGCSNALDLNVVSSVPDPVVTQLPLQVGVYYDEDFRNRVFEENSDDRRDWRIDTRAARLALFERVLPRMFRHVEEVPGPRAPEGSDIDAVLHPRIEALQVALPEETHMDFYEAWVRYEIRFLEPGGDPIDSWTVTGYGKENENGIFNSRSEHLNAAIETALRDIGARLVLGFRQRPRIQAWLCARPDASMPFCATAAYSATGPGMNSGKNVITASQIP